MTPIAEVRIPVTLDRPRELIFNANTMAAYEQESEKSGSGKSYWETMLRLMEFYEEHGEELQSLGQYEKGEDRLITARRLKLYTNVMRYITTAEIRALLWAALHEYDTNDDPQWDLSASKLGRLIKPIDTIGMVTAIIRGHNGNAPDRRELGEASGEQEQTEKVEVLPAEKTRRPQLVNGGAHTIALPAEDFA